MPKSAKGYTEERLPEIVALDTYLKDSKSRSLKETVNILYTSYLSPEQTEASYYQRIQKLCSGEYKTATKEERAAVRRFLHIESNPHLYGSVIHKLGDIPRKIGQLERYLQSGYQNKTESAKRIKELKALNTLTLNS